MTTKKTLNEKIAELDSLTNWFYSDDFELDKAVGKYKEAVTLANEIKKDLSSLKNEIAVIDKDFKED